MLVMKARKRAHAVSLQVTVHYRLKNAAGEATHVTECFECAPKQSRNKTYPVCTIRNTPDKPIHCIVWAKELLFARLFGRCMHLLSVSKCMPKMCLLRPSDGNQGPLFHMHAAE